MTTQITARVVEPKRIPRPTLYIYVYPYGTGRSRHWASTQPKTARNDAFTDTLVEIPGELEQARADAIGKAKDAAITAATYARDRAANLGLSDPEFTRLAQAIAALAEAEKGTAHER